MQKIYSRTTHFLTYAILLENRLKYYNKRNSVLIAVWSYNQVLHLAILLWNERKSTTENTLNFALLFTPI